MLLVPSSKACSQTEGAGPCGLSRKSARLCRCLPQLHGPHGRLTTVTPVTRVGGRHPGTDGGLGTGAGAALGRGGSSDMAGPRRLCFQGSRSSWGPGHLPWEPPCSSSLASTSTNALCQGQERSGGLHEPLSVSHTFLGRRQAAYGHILGHFQLQEGLSRERLPRTGDGQGKLAKSSPSLCLPWPCAHGCPHPGWPLPSGALCGSLLPPTPPGQGTCS